MLRSKQKACASNAVLVIVFVSVKKNLKKKNHASMLSLLSDDLLALGLGFFSKS